MKLLEATQSMIFDKNMANYSQEVRAWLLKGENLALVQAGVIQLFLFDGEGYEEIEGNFVAAYLRAQDLIINQDSNPYEHPITVKETWGHRGQKIFSITLDTEKFNRRSFEEICVNVLKQMSRKQSDDSGEARLLIKFVGPVSAEVLQEIKIYLEMAMEVFSSEQLRYVSLALDTSATRQSLPLIRSMADNFAMGLDKLGVSHGFFNSDQVAIEWLSQDLS